MRYRIEQKIETLSSNAVMKDERIATFTIGSLILSHWDFKYQPGLGLAFVAG